MEAAMRSFVPGLQWKVGFDSRRADVQCSLWAPFGFAGVVLSGGICCFLGMMRQELWPER